MPFDESQYQRSRCYSDTPVIRLSQGQQNLVTLTLRDEEGNAKDLTSLVEIHGTSSSSSGEASGYEVKLAASHCLNADNIEFEIDGTFIDMSDGTVKFQFTPTETNKPGIFVASVGVFYNDILRFNQMFYLEFMPTNFTAASGGPITVPEVRMEMMDMCPDANYLIDELEFTDAEIIHAMRWCVDQFNEMNPPVGGYAYDQFPFRAHWLSGTAGHLLKMVAHRYRRNSLNYTAGGVTIRDQEKYNEYYQVAEREEQKYLDWAQNKRIAINMANGYGSVGPSPYGAM